MDRLCLRVLGLLTPSVATMSVSIVDYRMNHALNPRRAAKAGHSMYIQSVMLTGTGVC